MNRSSEVNRLLRAHAAGDRGALDALFPILYNELKRVSRAQLARAGGRRSIDSTTLVHELYLKLANHDGSEWDDRQHFMSVAARAMRHIVVDYARRTVAAKRGGGAAHETLIDCRPQGQDPVEVLALDTALTRLEELSARLGQVVQLRFFAGLSVQETAGVLGVDPSTVKRDWSKARAFLSRELDRKNPPGKTT